MKNCLIILFALAICTINSCSNAQTTKTSLSASEFSEKIIELPSAAIVDVRTAEEFSKGHLLNAKNMNWNGNDFKQQVSKLDKSKPTFIYCLSGGRSAAAASQMRADGFAEVYELNGGLMKWRAANLPEVTSGTKSSVEMSKKQFEELTNSSKLVLVDFYADWCAPCKKMKPYLDEISKDMANKVVVIRINADDNPQLCKDLKVESLPVLQLYKNKKMTWSNTGFINKEDVMKQIKGEFKK